MSDGAPILLVAPPRAGGAPAAYAAEVVLQTFLGIDVALEEHGQAGWRLSCRGRPGAIVLPDCFFADAAENWLAARTLPPEPLAWLAPDAIPFPFRNRGAAIPIPFHAPSLPAVAIDEEARTITFGVDIFASAFMMLSRYEEAVDHQRDEHARFTASQSLAARHDFLKRPVVHEWTELLAGALEHLWPGIVPRRPSFALKVSCDVDHLELTTTARTAAALRRSVGDVVRRGSIGSAVATLTQEAAALRLASSPYDDLLWLMQENEKAGNRVTFFMLAGRTEPRFDGVYDITDAPVVATMRQMHERGHEIGLHNSYGTLGNAAAITSERERLEVAGAMAGLPKGPIGVRAHFLRYDALRSPAAFEAAGLAYDSTLGFADAVGFRCGACRPYPMFDLAARRPLKLIEVPLVAMEASLLRPEYMAVRETATAVDLLQSLKEACRWAGGAFTLLWHNTSLSSHRERDIYRALLA